MEAEAQSLKRAIGGGWGAGILNQATYLKFPIGY